LVHFPNEPARRIPDLKIRRIDHWPEHQVKLRCHPSLRSLISQVPTGRIETSRRRHIVDSDGTRMAKGFISIAEMLLLGSRPPRPMHSDPATESRVGLRQFFRDQYRTAGERPDFSRKTFLRTLVDQPEVSALECQSESVGTIMDGQIVPARPTSEETLSKTYRPKPRHRPQPRKNVSRGTRYGNFIANGYHARKTLSFCEVCILENRVLSNES